MNKLTNLFQAAYLGFAALFIYQAIANWEIDPNKSYLFIGGALLAIFKFFFNKKYRKRFEAHYDNKEKNNK